MTAPRLQENSETSFTHDLLRAVHYYIRGRRGLLFLGGLVLTAGLALNWGWLVAAGIAPILLGVLPCLAMCALGLCMKGAAGRSCSTNSTEREVSPAVTDDAKRILRNAAINESARHSAGKLPLDDDAAKTTNPETQSLKKRRKTDA